VTAAPNREEGVTSKENQYGWYRKGPIGPDFHIPEVLPHLFDKSMSYVTKHSDDAKSGKPFFLYLPLPAPHTPIVPIAPFRDASGINPYADFVMQVDHLMGRLLDCLREQGLEQNTLVIFTSDNGCSPQANFELLEEHGHDPSGIYRGHKADIFEGGHRVPLIIKWPGHITPRMKANALVCHTDIYTSLAEIVNETGHAVGGEDGFSLLPVFNGKKTSDRAALVSHSIDGSFAIREGSWKLCLCHGSGGWSLPKEKVAKAEGLPPLQLYDLSQDVAETTNIAEKHPAKVWHLLRLLDDIVQKGRSTAGDALSNDREVTFLPKGVMLPGKG
jgi:arylsulfatase A